MGFRGLVYLPEDDGVAPSLDLEMLAFGLGSGLESSSLRDGLILCAQLKQLG
jgi:hypothetical protein